MIGVGERAGSGIPTIIETWMAATQQPPSYEISYSPDRVTCVIRLGGVSTEEAPKGEGGLQDTIRYSVMGEPIESVEKTPQKTPQKIIELVKENANITTSEMAEIIGIDRSNIARAIKKLQTDGLLRRVGPDKGGHWEVIDRD